MEIQFVKGAKFTPWPLNPHLLVIHWAGTSGQGCVDTFRNSLATGSAHYIVFETGKIVQMVEEKFIAWHCGISSYKDYQEKDRRCIGWGSLNPIAIGIECAGPPSVFNWCGWPPVEIDALIELCKDIKTRYPQIKITDHWAIVEHGRSYSRDDVRGGRGVNIFPWGYLLEQTGIEEA